MLTLTELYLPFEKKIKSTQGMWHIKGIAETKKYRVSYAIFISNKGLKKELTSEKIIKITNDSIEEVINGETKGKFSDGKKILSRLSEFIMYLKRYVSNLIEREFGKKVEFKDLVIESIEFK